MRICYDMDATKGGFVMAKKEKKKKEPKRKPKYGLFSCVGYIYRLLWKYERRLAFVGIFTVPISLCLSALALYTPSAILSVLEVEQRLIRPCTSYPFSSKNSARYDPSCPVIPVISAFFIVFFLSVL